LSASDRFATGRPAIGVCACGWSSVAHDIVRTVALSTIERKSSKISGPVRAFA